MLFFPSWHEFKNFAVDVGLISRNHLRTVISISPSLKQNVGGGVADSTVVRKWKWFFVIAMQNPNLYRNETFKLVPILDQCINVLGDYVDKYSGSLFNAGSKIALCNF